MPHVLSILLLFLLLLAPLAQAATYYVDRQSLGGTCNNSNAGGPTTPRCTILAGLGLLGPGDTLQIRAGTYPEVIYDDASISSWPSGTSEGARITVKAAPGETVTILHPGGLFLRGNGAYLTFQDLIIDGNGNVGGGGFVTSGAGFEPHHIRFVNCEFQHMTGEFTVTSAHDIEFLGGRVHDSGDGSGLRHGFYFGSGAANVTVDGVAIYNQTTGYGVHLFADASIAGHEASNIIIRNSTIYNNGTSSTQSGIVATGVHGAQIYNNVIYGNGGSGIVIGHGAPVSMATTDVLVYHNTIYGNFGTSGYYGIFVRSSGTGSGGHIIRNNIAYNNGTGNYATETGGVTEDHNLFGINPLFVNAGAADFHLATAGSPAVGIALTTTGYTTDKDGASRGTVGGASDAGAYEFGGTSLTPSQGVFFLSPSGTNTTDCAAAKGTVSAPSSNPFGTYSMAFLCMLGGSTLYLRAGTYPPLDSQSTPPPAGTSGSPTTISGFPGETATLQGGPVPLYLRNPASDQFLIVSQLILDANNILETNGFVAINAHDIRLESVEITRSSYEPVFLSGSTNIELRTVTLHDNVYAGMALLGVQNATNITVTGSTLANGQGPGIQTYGGTSGLVVEKTTIRNNAGKAILLSGDTNPKITNNLLYANTYAVHLQTGVSGAQVYYNSAWNNSTACMLFDAGVTGQATNNICWASATMTNNAGAGMVLTTNQCTGASGCTAGDPLFVSTTPGDAQFLRLGASSPARDTGTPIPSLTTDITGKNRPDGSGVDKGAYEEVPVPAAPVTPGRGLPFASTHFLTSY